MVLGQPSPQFVRGSERLDLKSVHHGRRVAPSPRAFVHGVDIATGEEYWISGPKRDRSDTRYGPATTLIDDDVRDVYEAFLGGAPLPGREQG